MAPVIQFVGYKNSGKTTLISRLLEVFQHMNIRVAVIKHDMHGFDTDREGTDTFRHRQAGAAATAITSPWRTAIMEERETSLEDLIRHFADYDLIMVEGFKQKPYPKMVLLRSPEDEALLKELTQVCAVVQMDNVHPDDAGYVLRQSGTETNPAGLHRYQRDEIERIASYIRQSFL